jgi:hypothetical protein
MSGVAGAFIEGPRMSSFQLAGLTFAEYASVMLQEANLADLRAETLCNAALKVQQTDPHRAEALWHTCRKIRVQALLDRGRAAGARARTA